MKKIFTFFMLFVWAATAQAQLTLTVSAATDNGTGAANTLSAAITSANAYAGAGDVTINFTVPTVSLNGSALPDINQTASKTVTMNGLTGNTTITRTSATAFRIFNITDGDNVVMNRLIISNGNSSVSDGGGVLVGGQLTMTDCRLIGNSANFGGGISGFGILLMTNCTVSGNSATTGGGGVDTFSGSITLTNCVIVNNTANGGGGINNDGSSTLTVTNCTVSANTASGGGGIRNSSTLTLRNTAVVFNSAPSDPNFIGNAPNNINSVTVNPASYPFHSPRNLRLLPTATSLIGQGTVTGAPVADLDGNPRANPPSIGAYEGVAATPSVSFASTNGQTGVIPFTGTGVSVNATTNNGVITVQRYNNGRTGAVPTANGSPYYWIISTTGTAFSGSATFDWSGIANNGVNTPATVQLLRRDGFGTAWSSIQTGGAGTSITVSGLTGFSEFALGGGGDNPLPVTLNGFRGSASQSGVSLDWNTASETNNAGFSILRDGSVIASYTNLNELRGRGTTTSASSYAFTDATVEAGRTYTYSLRSHDLSGTVHDYPTTVSVEVSETPVVRNEYALEQNYPNPFNPVTNIQFTMKAAGQATLVITDMLGRTVSRETLNASAGVNQYRFNGARLTSGTYFYQLRAGEFSQTRKMVLVK